MNLYECKFQNIEFIIEKDSKINIEVEHGAGKTDEDVERLWLIGNKIEYLIHPAFAGKFPNLKKLEVEQNSIKISDPIVNCENIVAVDFKETDLSNIPENFFNDCTNMDFLNLVKTGIFTHSSADFFQNLPNLRKLIIQREVIFHLKSQHLRSLGNLEQLTIADCVIHDVDKNAFESIKELKNLYIINSSIVYLLLDTFSLSKITELILNQNGITSFQSDAFGKMDDLKYLSMNENEI
jgi:Leucine-rich repeat (LRR) protein